MTLKNKDLPTMAGRIPTGGSGDYRLTDDEQAIEYTLTGRRWPINGRQRDVYRALSYARGRYVSAQDLIQIVWKGYADISNVALQIKKLRQRVSSDVVESMASFGYIVR